jgi:hypothetical protein
MLVGGRPGVLAATAAVAVRTNMTVPKCIFDAYEIDPAKAMQNSDKVPKGCPGGRGWAFEQSEQAPVRVGSAVRGQHRLALKNGPGTPRFSTITVGGIANSEVGRAILVEGWPLVPLSDLRMSAALILMQPPSDTCVSGLHCACGRRESLALPGAHAPTYCSCRTVVYPASDASERQTAAAGFITCWRQIVSSRHT